MPYLSCHKNAGTKAVERKQFICRSSRQLKTIETLITMPQGANTTKSKSNKKSRPPAHQNTFAFKHNPKSKRTDKILNSPIEHCCRRCVDKLEWRKQYRKYKPLTQLAKCNLCSQKNIKSAYHTICESCTTSNKAKKQLTELKQKETATIILNPSLEDVSDQQAGPLENQLCLTVDSIHRVCAMCVKEVALPDEEEAPETVDDILARESRRVSLRERRSMERKLEKETIDEKKLGKAERRRLRRLEEGIESGGDDDDNDDKNDSTIECDDEIPDESDDEEDPFLKAIGGADKLLVGDSYQQMLLSRIQVENEI